MELYKLYKEVNGVPVYIRPSNFYGVISNVTRDDVRALREKYRCFISENVRWKARVKSIIHDDVIDDAKFTSKLVRIILMGRANSEKDKVEVESKLRSMGIKLNPYGMGSPICFGFYLKSFNDIDRVVGNLIGKVDAVAIVNTVWYLKFNRLLNLRRLIEKGGFTPREEKAFKAVMGVVNYSTVRVFYNGTVGVYAPHTPESITVLGKQLFSLFDRVGALM